MTAKLEWRRSLTVRYTADVAVLGGGIAGVCAACAAARTGARVILVERFGVTGGMFTVGGVGNWCGDVTGQGRIFDEIQAGLAAFGVLEAPENRLFDPEVLAVVLQELLRRYGVKPLLHTTFTDVLAGETGRLQQAVVCGASGPEGLEAKQWIDATGEGQVAARAGFATMKGRPGDERQLPMSLLYFIREMPEPQAQVPAGWVEPLESEADLPMTSVWPNGPGSKAIKIKIPKFDATDTESLTAAELAGRRRMLQVLDYHQRREGRPWRLERCSPLIGIREGRRVVGDYVLTVDDLRAGRRFADAVAYGSFYLDGHNPDDDKRTYILPENELGVPPYQIPLGCLIAQDGQNLWLAGRCFSADQLALSSARVGTTCAMLGQAAGVGAALAARSDQPARGVEVTAIQQILREFGAAWD